MATVARATSRRARRHFHIHKYLNFCGVWLSFRRIASWSLPSGSVCSLVVTAAYRPFCMVTDLQGQRYVVTKLTKHLQMWHVFDIETQLNIYYCNAEPRRILQGIFAEAIGIPSHHYLRRHHYILHRRRRIKVIIHSLPNVRIPALIGIKKPANVGPYVDGLHKLLGINVIRCPRVPRLHTLGQRCRSIGYVLQLATMPIKHTASLLVNLPVAQICLIGSISVLARLFSVACTTW